MSKRPSKSKDPLIVVGPVIGLVTETTARVLIETNVACTAVCKAKPSDGGPVLTEQINAVARRPVCFKFRDLKPATTYRLRINIPCVNLSKAEFTTLQVPSRRTPNTFNVAFVTRTSYTYYRDEAMDVHDLWTELLKNIRKKNINYLVHLGDNLYIDNDEYGHSKGQREFIGDVTDNAWQLAVKSLDKIGKADYHQYREQICELFRDTYRRTWNCSLIKQVLASVPNLMFLNEYEVRVGFGDKKPQDDDLGSLEYFVANCAYQIYHEYQYNLWSDFPPNGKLPSPTPACPFPVLSVIHKTHRLAIVGDVGFISIDVRYGNRFHRDKKPATGENFYPLLGKTQFDDIQQALTPDGLFKDCKLIFVISPKPVCLFNPDDPPSAGEDIYVPQTGNWWHPDHLPETVQLLHLLFNWKKQSLKHDVCILSGGVGQGLSTDIRNLAIGATEDDRCMSIKQFCVGPISAPTVSSYLRKILPQIVRCRPHSLGRTTTFTHFAMSSACRQYAVVEIDFSYVKPNQQIENPPETVLYTFQTIDLSDERRVAYSKPVLSNQQFSFPLQMAFLGCCGAGFLDFIPKIPDIRNI